MSYDADAVVVGAGLAGLVATAELADSGRRVLLLDQESEASLGGQSWWSFGGLFLVDSPEQRRLGVRDSRELALADWMGSAGFDRPEDLWPRRWAEAYVDFAAGEKRHWLAAQGMRWFPVVQWAERGGYGGWGHGNSVPRFHVTWGTGPGVVEPFERRVREHVAAGRVEFRFRHRVDELTVSAGGVDGVAGTVLEDDLVPRGVPSSRNPVREFRLRAQAVLVTSGGIGANHELVREAWPAHYGQPPATMLSGVPDHVDGRMLKITQAAGGAVINPDRMWNYPEGIQNHTPVWSRHGIRILSGPSPLWLDADGKRFPPPLYPGFDALGAMEHIARTGGGYSWFVLNRRILAREFALSGSEQNPDLTGRSLRLVASRARGLPAPVQAFLDRGPDFVTGTSPSELVARMNRLTGEDRIDGAQLERELRARDMQLEAGFGKDLQLMAVHAARRYRVDRLIRVARPAPMLDPAGGPLVAVRLWILTRKTLGGVHTDLDGRVLNREGNAVPGLFAAGEVAGFGGGGVHGYRALEGTFLGGCIFSGRNAGRAAARGSA